jgi:TPR repeat protein
MRVEDRVRAFPDAILPLVFGREQPMLVSMGLSSWYRRLFSRPRQTEPPPSQAAAEHGDADAQFALGVQYSGAGEASDDLAQAVQWYRMAANQDHAPAQFNLGQMLANGQGTAQDDDAALIWIRKAAEGGEAGAQFSLGMRYHRSSVHHLQMDAAESRIEAYKWFHLSAVQGYKGSEAARERVTLSMTREEVADGNQRVAVFAIRKPWHSENEPASPQPA